MSRGRRRQKFKDKDVGGYQESTGVSEGRTNGLSTLEMLCAVSIMCSVCYVRWQWIPMCHPLSPLLSIPSLERHCCKHLMSMVPLCWKGLVADMLPMTFVCQTLFSNLPSMLSETFKDLESLGKGRMALPSLRMFS